MPSVRFSRDHRGYEHVYLVHAPAGRGGSPRSRVLYWFRTPPGVKVGREPFDEAVRAALEARHPDLSFDWRAITQAQAPPPSEVEPWRERRRAERSAKQAIAAGRRGPQTPEAGSPEAASPGAVSDDRPLPIAEEIDEEEGLSPTVALDEQGTGELTVATSALSDQPQPLRARHRRRGGRRRTRPSDLPPPPDKNP